MEVSMTRIIDKDRTELFSVVGAAYVPEHHTDGAGHDHANYSTRRETGVASLWLVFYAVIVGIAIFKHGGAGTAVTLAGTVLN
jgi:hypothetical protein